MVTIKSFDGGEFDGYLALPASGYGPGIVVLQEIFGVNNYMRSVVDWYGAHGFVALCPDLFWRLEPGVQLTDKGEDQKKAFDFYQRFDEAKAVEDSAAALNFLRQHPASSGRVGAVGFCLGGNLAYLLAVRFKPDCAAGYYGVSIEKSLDEAKNLSSPLLLHVAGRDNFCPPEAQAAIHAALDPNPLVKICDYPEREHAFGRPGGEHYHAADAELANLRTLEFFVTNLAGAGLASAQQTLSTRWDDHVKYEFATRNTDDTLGKHVRVALVVIVHFRDGKLAHEHIYWDQASVLAQLGLIDSQKLPVAGVESAEKVLDPKLPSNTLMHR